MVESVGKFGVENQGTQMHDRLLRGTIAMAAAVCPLEIICYT
jgi:hypothetical protein